MNNTLIDYDFIEIGTSDFETICQTASLDQIGLCVDPVKHFLDNLPVLPNVTKVNAAISDDNKEGQCEVFFIDPQYKDSDEVKNFSNPLMTRGCNMVGKPHPHMTKLLHLTTKELVKKIPIAKLFTDYNVRKVDCLKLDTEGSDCKILTHLAEYLKDKSKEYFPKTIIFESDDLSPEHDVTKIISLYKLMGYVLVYRHSNTKLEYLDEVDRKYWSDIPKAVRLLTTVCPNSTTDYDNLNNPDVVLVQAPGWGVQTAPLSLASLSAFVRHKGHKILPLDLNVEFYSIRPDKFSIIWDIDQSQWFWESKDCVNELLNEYKTQIDKFIELVISTNAPLVGFSLYNTSMHTSMHLIKLLKERKSDLKIIVGGPHAHRYLAGNDLAANPLIDAVAQAEGEETLVDIIERVRSGKSLLDCPGLLVYKDGNVVSTAVRPMVSKLDTLPIPDYSDFSLAAYLEPNRLPMASSRGCPNKCIYCNEQPYWESYRFRSAESMIEEVKHQMSLYPEINFVDFQDSLCNGKISAIEKFADYLIENKIKIQWAGQAVIRKEMTEALMIKLKQSGCVVMAYGLETPNPALMRSVGKLLSKGADINQIAESHARTGLGAVYNVMFGLPGETEEDSLMVLEFIRRNAKNKLFVNPSAAFCGFANGTPGWDNAEKFGIDKTLGGTFWKSVDGTNTFLTRLKRFEDFCKLVSDLGIKTTYPSTYLLNRNQVIAQYYTAIGQPENAVYYYDEWVKEHPEDETAKAFLKKQKSINGATKVEIKSNVYAISRHSDENWLNGISRNWGPVVLFTHVNYILEELTVGKIVEFANGERRKIIKAEDDSERDSIKIIIDGEFLDGDQVGWPNLLKVIEKPNIIIPIKPFNYTEIEFNKL